MENSIQIRLLINDQFPIPGLLEKIVSEWEKLRLQIDVDTTSLAWTDAIKTIFPPNGYRPMIAIELTDNFFSLSQLVERICVLKPLALYLDHLYTVFEKKGLQFGELLEVAMRQYLLAIYYRTDDIQFQFSFDIARDRQLLIPAWTHLLEILEKFRKIDKVTVDWIDAVPREKNNVCFCQITPEEPEWRVMDRLREACDRLSLHFRSSIGDERIRKPYIIFNEENFRQHFYLDTEWNLLLGDKQINFPQPNDIALYVRLLEGSLIQAEQFYKDEAVKRSDPLYMPMLATEEYLRFYDYFQAIIACVIFSYTAIETLANMAIPDEFEYVEEGKGKWLGVQTVYSKEAIERNFSLRDKLKVILPKVLGARDPIKEPWWNDFIALEDIRNEVIHTKQSKSEERYSLFLDRRIFKIIRCYSVVITFYGEFINRTQRQILFDFPYGYGFDSVPPSFISNEDFEERDRRLYNPWRPKEDEEANKE